RRRGTRDTLGDVGPQSREGGTVRTEEMIFVSVDDHVVEPPDMFEGRLPAKYADMAPHVAQTEKGDDVWAFNGNQIPNIGLNAVAGRPRAEYGIDATPFHDMRQGRWPVPDPATDL